MALLISDTNIFIDFEDGGLLQALFRLPESVGVPDLLFEDELRDEHAHLLDHGLVLVELSAGTIARAVELAAKYRKPSRLDLAALAAAEQESCPLLTGDRSLRSAARAEGVEVHGTLWVAERLVRAGVVSTPQLRTAYAKMKASGRRLPWVEVERQLQRLASSG
ncbi:MAG: PIN domain-containing protein [Myxococcota bacterium]|nr:PIN domain-containing protein [Myxococcota bacterium]